MGDLPQYKIGEKGLSLVQSPLHVPEGGLLSAQNVEFVRDAGIGGIGSRGGLANLNAIALGASALQLTNVPLTYPPSFGLMVGLNAGEDPNTWKTSTDGITYTNLTSTAIVRPAGIGKSPVGLGAGAISSGQRCASFKGQFYFPGDDYIVYPAASHTAPPFIVWNGTAYVEMFRVPTNSTSTAGSHPIWISDTLIVNGIIYIAVYDPGGSAPDHKGRVLAYDPTNGTLALVGNRFGNGSGENTAGFPFCLAYQWGRLWAGTYGISGNNQGKIYSILPGVEETWTLDHTATLHNGYYMSLAGFNGNLYACTDADSSGTAIVEQRTSTGTWSTSLTAPAANSNYFTGAIVFNSELYVCYYKTSTGVVLIKKYDGSSWSTDLDVAGTYAAKPPGLPFVFGGKLYWPFLGSETGPTNLTGFLLERTTGGVWTRRLNAIGIRGCLGRYTP